ncbi:MAG: 1-phosphofructokinase [Ruminiclostridium sp.]|nr:1-phosphofructokinase [Ruminiclostridium sp.]
MIYTVTFNPAVDYVMPIDELRAGATNRSAGEEIYFGGKGINVSAVLNELGVKSRALGFTAGFTGAAIEQGLRDMGIDSDFIRLEKGCSRINVKLKSGDETEINGQGPDIDSASVDRLFEKLDKLTAGDTVVLAGNVPKTLPADIYERILGMLDGKGVRAVVDASGKLLLNVLKYRPFLIKPNRDELAELFGADITGIDDVERYAKKLKEMGAVNVLVSMAGDGALLVDADGVTHRCGVFRGTVRNSVGAGDSMVAGFLTGCESGDYEYALKLGTAAGGAAAFSDGLPERALIDELMKQSGNL